MSTQGLANNALHTDGAPVPGCARHGAPRVSAKPLGGRPIRQARDHVGDMIEASNDHWTGRLVGEL